MSWLQASFLSFCHLLRNWRNNLLKTKDVVKSLTSCVDDFTCLDSTARFSARVASSSFLSFGIKQGTAAIGNCCKQFSGAGRGLEQF